MSYSRIPSAFAFSLFFSLLPLSAIAFQNPCKQMQRNLDREIDTLKNQHKLDLLSCNQTSGLDSPDCMNLKTSQAQELQDLRDRRTRLKAGCRNYVARGVVSGIPADDQFVNTYFNDQYPQKHHYNHHHHYPPGKHPKTPPVTQPGGGGGAGSIKTAQKPNENPGAGQSTKQDKPPIHDGFKATSHAPDRDASAHQRGDAHNAQNQSHQNSFNSSTAHSGWGMSHSGGSTTNSSSGGGNSSSTTSASHSSPSSSSSSSASSAPAQSNSGSSSSSAGNSAPSSHSDSGASRPK